MKRHIVTGVLLMVAIFACGQTTAVCGGYNKVDKNKIDSLLRAAHAMPRSTCWELFFARAFIGVPYIAHTLEVNDSEQLVVNTRELDCTTLVENVTALTLCVKQEVYTFKNFIENLTAIRYRKGIIDGYASRLHYFTEWIVDNTEKGLVCEVQSPQSVFKAVQTINIGFMSAHPEYYKHLKNNPELVSEIKALEKAVNGMAFRYIPKNAIPNTKALRNAVHDGDIIAITCKKAGLDIAHLGFAVWHKDGLHLLNASMIHKKVVEEPMLLSKYLSQHPSHTGIRIIRISRL